MKDTLKQINKNDPLPPPTTKQLQVLNRQKIDISSPKLISTMTATKAKIHLQRDAPALEEKPLIMQYNKQADKAKIRSVTPENVQKSLEDMDLDFSKYNNFKAQQQRHQ